MQEFEKRNNCVLKPRFPPTIAINLQYCMFHIGKFDHATEIYFTLKTYIQSQAY